MTEYTLAKTAGFCFGVNRAVDLVFRLLDEGKRPATLGPIIHNPQLVDQLARRGVRIAQTPDEVPELLDEELPQQLLASAFRKYSK